MSIISVDVGYGYTKAVSSEGKRTIFPSVIAPARSDILSGVFSQNGAGHRVSVIRALGRRRNEWLVGELAARSHFAVASLSHEKPEDLHDTLLLSAAAMVTSEPIDCCVIGLPLAFYKSQRDHLKRRLEGTSAMVGIESEPLRELAISRIMVVPQGAGVVFAQPDISDGLAGVVDIGQYTVDYLLMAVKNGNPAPLVEYCGSFEAGAYLLHKAVQEEFQRVTGTPLDAMETVEVLDRSLKKKNVVYRGIPIDLSLCVEQAVADVGRLIAQKTLSAWGAKSRFVERVLLAGGGAILFGEAFKREFPVAEIIKDPLFANAKGYLVAAKGGGK